MAAETAVPGMQISMAKMDELHSDTEFNCRGAIAPIDVTDLSRSMDSHGLQLPIEIQPYSPEMQAKTGKKYLIICGNRRFRAAQLLKWTMIPAIIKTGLTEAQARIRNLTENLNRKDLNIMQEAKAIANLRGIGLTEETVGAELNKSRGWVQVRFMLLSLPQEVQHEAAADLLNQEQIRELYKLRHDPDAQAEVVRQIKDARSRGEKVVKPKPKPKSVHTKEHRSRPQIFEMIEHIGDSVGMNFGTRCLAWAAGEISDNDLFLEIASLAKSKGRRYEIPTQALSEVPERDYANSEFV